MRSSFSIIPLLIGAFFVTGCTVKASGSASARASSSSSSSSSASSSSSSGGSRPAPTRPVQAEPAPESVAVVEPEPAPESVAVVEPEPADEPEPAFVQTAAIKCAGKEVIELSNVAIDGGSMPAIQAAGQCRVSIESCTIASTGVVISAAGKAQVTLNGCAVTGGDTAIEAAGNGVVRLTGGSLSGAAVAKGRGLVEHDGVSLASR